MAKRKPRITHVECTTPSGWRWLKIHARGATLTAEGSFVVYDESEWSQCLAAAGGKEVP